MKEVEENTGEFKVTELAGGGDGTDGEDNMTSTASTNSFMFHLIHGNCSMTSASLIAFQ